MDRNMKFLERHQKQLPGLGNGQPPRNMQLGYEPSSYQQRPSRQAPQMEYTPSIRGSERGSNYGGSNYGGSKKGSSYGRR